MFASNEWQQSLASLVNSVGESHFCRLLADACQEITGYESTVISQFTAHSMPAYVYDNLSPELSAFYHRNLSAEYLLDPFYTLFENRAPGGVYRLHEIAPDNFFKSPVYKKYYEPSHLSDETSVFTKLSEDRYLLLDMGNRIKPRVSQFKIRQLKAFFPVIESLCLKHEQIIGERHNESEGNVMMGAPLDRAFQNFGKDHLSNRESEVIQLILKGHSNKSIARLLEISVDTVKVYNKRFHLKLNISSQAELFSLFLESISMLPVNSDEDPLTHYLRITA